MAERWITKNGRRIPIVDGGGGKAVAAGVAAVMIFGGGGVTGAAGGSSVGVETVSVRKADAKRSARKGKADDAWRRMGMRRLKRSVSKRNRGCVRVTWGEVRRSLLRDPCTSLDRRLFAIADRRGNIALVSVAWVRFRTSDARRRFQDVIDVYGTGDIRPLGAGRLGLAHVRFTGRYYHSIPKRARLTVAEAEAVKGGFDPKVLDGLAEIAAELPSPRHRRR
ncbi:hypothetical protein HUT06_01270 [Actinomadura sp. NAK00032]|uniref:hypothetical protein n=1 Tax=Actinomadura sp. NAK00032 TaxID=2742128 RepID=UPI0015927383|nr:hypothetical protein [Actinomadura sp. NAK00032]QKW32833.1 hypothetical protein HUT06_01270 [Actinomadura sp. NAK00032]